MPRAEALPEKWWRDPQTLVNEVKKFPSRAQCARAHGLNPSILAKAWQDAGLPKISNGGRHPTAHTTFVEIGDDAWLLAALKKYGDTASVEDLANHADVSPKKVRDALERLGRDGYRVAEADDAHVVLDRLAPETDNLHVVSPALFDGEQIRVGIVSDTHLGANEEALDELHAAYDVFAREGIAEVWHAGDWGTGVGMFRTHHAESKVHSAEEHTDYLADNYPVRPGIVTRGIGGNHDLEGEFGRIGFDAARALANRRDDIEYLGEYSAWLELRPGTGSWIHLLHGSGGMSYAYSYKAQKLVDGYPSGRKPAALIVGHWHVRGNIRARDVEVVWPGCFEWQSRFLKRLGLHPAVGFHILEATVADDGSIVRWRPEWFPFYAGRKAVAA